MSYRDLRNFTEMMRVLSYPRLISMENFRNPNFPLVAEILVWLVERIDPTAAISGETSEEADRVHLIRTAAHTLALKAGLKLNTKKLYQADGYAVRELIKVASLLSNSLKLERSLDEAQSFSVVDTALKVQEAVAARQQVSDIAASGAALYDLLGQEPELREIRQSRAAKPLEIAQVETAVKEAIANVTKEIAKTKDLINNVTSNENSLDSKIEKKKSDLERHTKRLQSLKKMRPAFMDEFEKVEQELRVLYEAYVIKARNLSYFESVLDQALQAENDRRELRTASARRNMEDMKNEEQTLDLKDMLSKTKDEVAKKERRTAAKSRVSAVKGKESFGTMKGGIEDSDDSLDDSDSDLLLDGVLTEDEDAKDDFKDLSEDDF